MGFLSGVLSAVKNENEVTTYDNYITKPNKNLNEVLDTLTNNIGTGRDGLAASVDAVREWLEEYNDKHTWMTYNVTNELGKLITNLNTATGKYYQDVSSKQNSPLADQLRSWTQTIAGIEADISSVENNNVNVLDSALNEKLIHELNVVKSAVGMLKASAGNGELVKQVKAVDAQLERQQNYVIQAIATQCENMRDRIDKKIKNLVSTMVELSKVKKTHMDYIRSNLEAAYKDCKALNEKIDSTYRFSISTHFQNIKHNVEQFVKESNTTLLLQNIETVKTQVQEMAGNVKQDLNTLQHKIMKEICQYVRGHVAEIKAQVGIIKGRVGEKDGMQHGKEMTVYHNWKRLKDVITKFVEGLTNKDSGLGTRPPNKIGKLQEIIQKAGTYAGHFTEQRTFEGILQQWVYAILKNEPVNGWIHRYVDGDRQHKAIDNAYKRQDKDDDDGTPYYKALIGKITEEIIKMLKQQNDIIDEAVKMGQKPTGETEIEKYVDTVHVVCDAFAERLYKKIKQDETTYNNTLIDKITWEIEQGDRGILTNRGEASNNKYLLTNAVQLTIYQLLGVVKGVASEVPSFAGDAEDDASGEYNLGRNVDAAIKSAIAIGEQCKDKKDPMDEDFGPKMQNALDSVKQDIFELDRDLGKAIVISPAVDPINIRGNYKVAERVDGRIGGILQQEVGNTVGDQVQKPFGVDNFMDQFNSVNTKLLNTVPLIDQQLDALKQVPHFVDMQKQNADGVMRELNDEVYVLHGNINFIIEKVNEADKAFQIAIDAVQQHVQNTEMSLRSSVIHLKEKLTQVVQNAFKAVTRDVQKSFATERTSDLAALKSVIDTQKSNIKYVLDDDKKSGLKGLLHLFNNKLPDLDKTDFPSLVSTFQHLYNQTHRYVKYQLDGVDDADPDSQPETPDPLAALLVGLTGKVDKLLSKLERSGHFDYEFRQNLDALDSALQLFTPSKFGGPCTVLLDVVKGGVTQMAGELDKAYVSRYSGQRITWTEEADGKETLTRNAMKCGKVLLSVIPMIGELMRINEKCMSKEWYKKVIFRRNENNPVAKFLEESGYSIPSSDTKQEGDLRCGLTTLGIADRLTKESKICTYMGRDDGTLKILYDSLKRYNQVCHLALHSKPRHPCSVFEMLVWLTSLSYNSVYLDPTSAGFSDLFDKPEKKHADDKKKDSEEDEPMVTDLNAQTLTAYPRNVTYGGIQDAITHITHTAHELLVTIVGTGDASTIYSCDLSNNSLGFKYPTTAADCLQMLVDVLLALLPSLRYLERQCSLANQHSGWAKCFYGKGVKSFKWPCNHHSSDKATCQPNTKPNTKPNCQPNCQPSSPLMSYLNDCLPGHMPHRLQSVGCKAECKTCPTGQPGMTCITPLGFKAFSGSIRTGKDLCNIIREFLGHEYISGLLSLMPKPPSTLPQHFGFMLSMVRGWVDSAKLTNQRYTKNSFQSCFEASIADQSIRLYSDPSELTKAFTNAYGSQSVMHETCNYPHLVNLTGAEICRNATKDVDCSPYLMSLCDDSYYYVGYKHASTYLSWAVYLPWTFWRYLATLYNEFCNISCNDWGCSKCMHGDMCKPGKHGHVDEKSGISHCQCPSIVGCRGVSSTLYKFGFTFDDAKFLNRLTSAKTCTDFCTQLDKVLKSEYFVKLFKECDNFIWTIREPFTYLVLALWSLSLLYLICVMVGRLDVLHIRSHLRIPSSHKITAQSLLAEAQVGRLAKISYLQP